MQELGILRSSATHRKRPLQLQSIAGVLLLTICLGTPADISVLDCQLQL